jgi:hypothetical protein
MEIEHGKKTVSQEYKTALSRPWILLFREPIVLLLSIYMAIVYGTLYMMFAAFPIVYQQQRGWSPGVGGLAFVGVMVGEMIAVAYSIYDNERYKKTEAKHDGKAPPEARLPPAMLGSVFLPIGLFWFAWTNYPGLHWSISIIATAPFGFGMVLVFLSIMNYLIDSYVIYAASVLAANSVLRSLFGAAFPLFTTCKHQPVSPLVTLSELTISDMYQNLGIHWASSIPAFLALMCVPFPFLFYKYGESIRLKCKFAAEAAAALVRMRGGDQDVDEEELEVSGGEETEAENEKNDEAGAKDKKLDKEMESGTSKEQ